MKRLRVPFLFFLGALIVTFMSCSPATSSGSASNSGSDSGSGSSGGTPGLPSDPPWTTTMPEELSFLPNPSLIETTENYLTIVSLESRGNPKGSLILTINKLTGVISKVEIPDYNVVNFVQDPDGNFLCLTDTGIDPDCQVRLTTFSPEGVKLKEAAFAGAFLRYGNALAKCDDGVVLGIYRPDSGPELLKADFDGTIIWQKRYANELDPGLVKAEYIEPGVIMCIRKDVDENFIIAQQFIKRNTEDRRDNGYVIYHVNAGGELIWSKPQYLGVTEWEQYCWAQELLLLEDGSIVIEDSASGGGPGLITAIKYFDNAGDFIRTLYNARSGKTPIALSSDQGVIYANREYNPDPQVEKDETACYKFSLDGSVVWKQTYNPATTDGSEVILYPYGLFRLDDSGFLIVCGYNIENTSEYGVAVLITNENGERINELSF